MTMPKKKRGSTYKESQYRVIIFHPGSPTPAKYRNCELDRPSTYRTFLAFLDNKFPGWTAVNVYGGLTRELKRQINQGNK